jgi:endonuclease G
MSPQTAGFNRGIWSVAESQVRKWGLEYGILYVVTGPIFKNNLGAIGANEVTIPGYYYKIVFDGKDKMIGLVLPHASSSVKLVQFVVTVDFIEQQTGIDFFKGLDDPLENDLEGKISISGWF